MNRSFLLLSCTFLFLVSCRQLDIYERNTSIPGMAWKSDFAAKGTLTITDTNVRYRVYLVLRHTDAYKYENIWLNISLQGPGDSVQSGRYNVQLATDAQGWEGTGMNDIWEVRKLLDANSRIFNKKGDWNFSINHLMRDEPLLNIMSAGLRIEKAP